MDLRTAWTELGLDGPGPYGEEVVRRAYLRGLKLRKPETDPEGFRRLREAYELARAFADSDTDGAPDPEPPVMSAPPAASTSSAGGQETPQDESSLAAFQARLDALPPQPWTDRWQLARQAFATSGGAFWAMQLASDELRNSQMRTHELVAVLRQGVAEGDLASRWALLGLYPKYVPAEELARVRREGTTVERLQVGEALLEQDQADAAADVLGEVLAADQSPEHPLLDEALRFTLALHRRGQVAPAGRAFAAVKRYLGDSKPRAGETGEWTATVLLICGELDALPDLPPMFREDIARGLMEGDLHAASFTVRSLEVSKGFWAVRRLRKRLTKQAPTIASVLDWQPLESEEKFSWGGGFPLVWVLVIVVGFVARHCISSPDRRPAVAVLDESSESSTDGRWRAPKICSYRFTREDYKQIEMLRLSHSLGQVCPRMRLLSEYLHKSDCPNSRRMADELAQQAGEAPAVVRTLIEAAGQRVTARCPP